MWRRWRPTPALHRLAIEIPNSHPRARSRFRRHDNGGVASPGLGIVKGRIDPGDSILRCLPAVWVEDSGADADGDPISRRRRRVRQVERLELGPQSRREPFQVVLPTGVEHDHELLTTVSPESRSHRMRPDDRQLASVRAEASQRPLVLPARGRSISEP
jgi:hypothetical protein